LYLNLLTLQACLPLVSIGNKTIQTPDIANNNAETYNGIDMLIERRMPVTTGAIIPALD